VAGKVLQLDEALNKDSLACEVARKWHTWDMLREKWKSAVIELRKYIYQTDTTQTTNVSLPWKNKTTVPKICQIRDNLHANYKMSLFPKRKSLVWEADNEDSAAVKKKNAIESYMAWVIDRPQFKTEIDKLLYDWIDTGNAFAVDEWVDYRVEQADKTQVGYVGPVLRRIAPSDIVFNPIAPSFDESPKIIRSLVSLGEVKQYLERISSDANREQYEELFKYLRDFRQNSSSYSDSSKDEYLQMDGFTSYRQYLDSGYCELLTFYGDAYDIEKDEFLKNYEIVVVDRHKLIKKEPSPSLFGQPKIRHCGWRYRQDNLWAMGPLDNLVGMQYRIDHIENLKADLFDLTAFPPLKIRGYVEDFEWGPFAHIHVGDDGDVEILSPDVQALNANLEIQMLEEKMEVMAGSPKEAMGFRTPGEKTAYEVQRLENAAARIFQSKTIQFEEQMIEAKLNDMLEEGRRNMDSTQIRVFDDEFDLETFMTLSPTDIAGIGRIRPIAARHFAEVAEKVQNMQNFVNSPSYANPSVAVHFSGLEEARFWEEQLDLKPYNIVQPYVRISEEQEAQQLMNTQMERTIDQTMTPSGMTPEDTDEGFMPQ
jgi:hypothetical protein